MNKIIVIISSLFLLPGAKAQDCNKETILNVKGKWTTLANNVVNPEKTFPSGQYSQLYTRLDKIANMFQQAYPQPTGIEAEWYRSIRGAAIVKNGPVPYQFNSLYLGWYCNQNLHKLMPGAETGTWSFVYVNSFGWFMTDQNDKAGFSVDGADAWLLPKKNGEWKGLPLYKPSGSNDKNKAILITRDNQLPYKPVSRLQFLQSMKAKIEADKKLQHDAGEKQAVRSEAEEEAAKQKGLQNIEKNTSPQYREQRKAGYLKNYKTDEERKQENIRLSDGYFDGKLKPLNDELNNGSGNDLQQPAIVNNDYTGIFKGFSTDEKGGRMVVIINTSYFNIQLPKYAPQIIVLYWKWHNNEPALNFIRQLEENFPVAKLKAMIDK
jgi:hypothetical protein